jgi:hypothetical protein
MVGEESRFVTIGPGLLPRLWIGLGITVILSIARLIASTSRKVIARRIADGQAQWNKSQTQGKHAKSTHQFA